MGLSEKMEKAVSMAARKVYELAFKQ